MGVPPDEPAGETPSRRDPAVGRGSLYGCGSDDRETPCGEVCASCEFTCSTRSESRDFGGATVMLLKHCTFLAACFERALAACGGVLSSGTFIAVSVVIDP